MKITAKLRKQMNAAVRRVAGACYDPYAEVAARLALAPPHMRSHNLLNVGGDSDWDEGIRLRDLKNIDDCPAHPGRAELDLYVFGCSAPGQSNDRSDLVTNLAVFITDGEVVAAFDTEEWSAAERFRDDWLADSESGGALQAAA